jgi:hypothetical protein
MSKEVNEIVNEPISNKQQSREDVTNKKKRNTRDKNKIFQKDDEGNLLVPVEHIKNDTKVIELSERNVRYNKTKEISDEERLRRVEIGKRLGAIRSEKCRIAREEKERIAKEVYEKERIAEEEAKKKEIEDKIREGKLVRVKFKPKPQKRLEKKSCEETTTDNETTEQETTEVDTDIEEVIDRKKQRAVRKQAIKTAKAIEKIDTVLQKYTNPYMSKLMERMK